MTVRSRIHVHPCPAHTKFDHHVPFFGAVYDRDTYADRIAALIGLDAKIVLVSNGEPSQRLELAAGALRSHFPDLEIDNMPDRYALEDGWFRDESYVVCKKQPQDYQSLVDYYLSVYHDLPHCQQGPIENFRGFHFKRNMFWYHYGQGMPEVNNAEFETLARMIDPVWRQTAQVLQDEIDALGIHHNVQDNLVLRINHTEPGSKFDPNHLLPMHLDTSCLTAWVWTSHRGAEIGSDQKGTISTPVEKLFDQEHELLIIPGLDYCDMSASMKPATWHCVKSPAIDQHRVSIVAFLKSH